MTIQWDSLSSFDDWSEALKKLLSDAAAAIKGQDIGMRVNVQRQLNDFIDESPNALASELDEIARRAIEDIFRATLEEALAGIAARSAELSRHVKIIDAVTTSAVKDSKSIRLETASKAVSSATAVVRQLGELRDALKGSPDEAKISTQIDKATQALQVLVPVLMDIRR